MYDIIGNLIVTLAVVLAGLYVYKRYRKTIDSDKPGCGGCDGCCPGCLTDPDENDQDNKFNKEIK